MIAENHYEMTHMTYLGRSLHNQENIFEKYVVS